MAFNPDQFLAETDPSAFNPDKFLAETEPGFLANAWNDTKGLVKGTAETAQKVLDPLAIVEDIKQGSLEPSKQALTHPPALEVAKGIVPGLINEGKRIGVGELATGHPVEAVKKFGTAFYEKPVSTLLDVLPFIPKVGKALIPTKAAPLAKSASVAEAAIPAAETIGKVAAKAAPEASTLEGLASKVGKIPETAAEKMKSVNDYISKQYGKAAEKPGFADTLSAYSKKHARNMTAKTLGASPLQIRKIGITESEKLMDFALDKGIVSGKVGDIGAETKVSQINNASGQAVGDFRDLAKTRGATHDMKSLLNDITEKLKPEYKKQGFKGGQVKQLKTALYEVSQTPPTPDMMAKTITKLFQESKNMDRLKQPSGAYADVARKLRDANEKLISKHLDSKELNAYHTALEDYGATTQIGEFIKRKNAMEMGGRLGPGAGVSRMMFQKALDTVGYRTEAQIANRLSKWIKENPNAIKTPKDLFRKYVDEAAEAIDEMTGPEVH